MNSTVGFNKIINFLSKRMINSPILLYLHIPRLVCKYQNSKFDYNPVTFSVNRKRVLSEYVIHGTSSCFGIPLASPLAISSRSSMF